MECTFTVTVKDYAIKIGDQGYPTIKDALAAVAENNVDPVTIDVLDDLRGDGIMVTGNRNVVIDFHDHTYTAYANVGSKGTETQSIHIDSGSTVVLKNGTVVGN